MASLGRKIHAGTRHYAVLPLSFAVEPVIILCAEGPRHDLLPCPGCQNYPESFEIGEKSMSNWLQTIIVYHNIYFQFYMLFVPPKFAWKSQFPNCISWSLDGSENVCGDQNMHRLQLFSKPWKLRRVVKTKTCREKKENGRWTSGTLSLWHTIIV